MPILAVLADATRDHLGSSRALTGPVLVIPLAVIVAVIIWRGRADKRSWWAILLRVALAMWAMALINLAFFPLPLPPV